MSPTTFPRGEFLISLRIIAKYEVGLLRKPRCPNVERLIILPPNHPQMQ